MPNAIFGFDTPNLGDDVQALAAAALLPGVDAIIDRDRLDKVRLERRHRVIMNSWFAVKRYRGAPSPDLDPTYFGYCVGREELLNDVWLAAWRRAAPVGLRDLHSVETLSAAGVACRFSGCLTTWMGRFIKPVEKREGVVFVDVPEVMEAFIPAALRDRAERITNYTTRAIQFDQRARWRAAAGICDRLRSAEMVVTRRLHVALPCVGFGTPVMVYLEGTRKNRRRFSGHDRFLPIVFHDGARPVDGLAWVEPRTVEPPSEIEDGFLALAESFDAPVAPRWASVADVAKSIPDTPRVPRSGWSLFRRS